MKCNKCGNFTEFFACLARLVRVDTMDGHVFDLRIDEEQFSDAGGGSPFCCAWCKSADIEFSNADVDSFWRFFNARVDRRIRKPACGEGGPSECLGSGV